MDDPLDRSIRCARRQQPDVDEVDEDPDAGDDLGEDVGDELDNETDNETDADLDRAAYRAAELVAEVEPHGGQVVVSEAVRVMSPESAFIDLGEHVLRGIEQPERLLLKV